LSANLLLAPLSAENLAQMCPQAPIDGLLGSSQGC
jgi:hypothetical protein